MKRLLMIALLAGLTGGAAQKAVPCSESTVFQFVDSVFFPDITTVVVEAHISYPAVFPKPASTKEITTPYKMACKNFTATATKSDFTLTGNVANNFKHLISYWKAGDPDTTSHVKGHVDIAYYGYFYYENIREDWNQERLELTLNNGKLTLNHEGFGVFFKDLVVGYKINGGKLQPAYFQNNLSQIKHGPNDVVEIFAKGEKVTIPYLKIDFKRNIIYTKYNQPFPG